MILVDAKEATGIVQRMMDNLALIAPPQGREGSEARTAVGLVRATAFSLLLADRLGPPLDECFDLVRQAGATLYQFETVRRGLFEENPKFKGGKLVRNVSIGMCLAHQSKCISDMEFTNKQDVDQVRSNIQQPFLSAEELAADAMNSDSFKLLISLHAAINEHLVKTVLPLPRLTRYAFFEPLPSL
ncbi:MAG TPA: hypothetical protein VH593_19055, partial [Ktedonobacteraceae bacterium]